MKLVKIDDYTYVNPESIGAIKDECLGTNIYLTGSDKPIETSVEIKKVLDAICGSEEHLVNEAVIEMLYKTNNKLLETNQKLLNKIKSLNQ